MYKAGTQLSKKATRSSTNPFDFLTVLVHRLTFGPELKKVLCFNGII